MKLKKIVSGICPKKIPPRFTDLEISSISADSREVTDSSIFVARQGPAVNGADFIPQAITKGARVIVTEGDLKRDDTGGKDVFVLSVDNTKRFLLEASQRFYRNPSSKIKTIGITGTNGKTTIAYLLEAVFAQANRRCAVIGTVNYRIGPEVIASKNTTPGLMELQRYFSQMAEKKIQYCFMEVSSHALDQGRVDAIDFSSAIFTNLTGDHLDYHQTMENYFAAKSQLFTHLSKRATAIINMDDPYGRRLAGITRGQLITFGLDGPVDVAAGDLNLTLSGSNFTVKSPKGLLSLKTKLIGRHNVYNILAAVTEGIAQGLSLNVIKKAIENFECVPGRLEQIIGGQNFYVFVDYAHTEDALKNVLTAFRAVSPARIILVFGCGGDRDKTKRPKMGKIADALADWTILTSDNPRGENARDIIGQIIPGFFGQNYEVILDRKAAIEKALTLAGKKDIVLIAGKGHENYQIFKGETIPFDDRQTVRDFLKC